MEADKNCYFKGTVSVSVGKLTILDSVSMNDGGALIYTKTDCLMSLALDQITTSNIRSNYLTQ